MSRLDSFAKDKSPRQTVKPGGIEWSASVQCSVCMELVDDQLYYPNESLLLWTCSQGHRSYIEGFKAF